VFAFPFQFLNYRTLYYKSKALVLYLGYSRFESQPGNRLIEILYGFLQFLETGARILLRLVHNRFLQYAEWGNNFCYPNMEAPLNSTSDLF
jgi:hypothetical protein